MKKNRLLYFDCSAGISGDMTVAALLDLGADRSVLEKGLASLPVDGYQIRISETVKNGLQACDFHVILDKNNHDDDMEYLYGHDHDHEHDHDHHDHDHEHDHDHDHDHDHEHDHDHHDHDHDHEHSHDHDHEHDHDHHDHEHSHDHDHEHGHDHDHEHGHDHDHGHGHTHHDARNLHDVLHILRHGDLTPGALSLAERIFTIVAQAEAHVHGKTIEEVHFHEVGAVDSIVDIAAAAICIDNLHPDGIVVSPLTDGTGQIRCQHGIIPVPVPAVAAIAAQQGLDLKLTSIYGELVTPTGAAIAAAIRTAGKLPETFRILKSGLGAGKRNYPTSNVLRVMLLETEDTAESGIVRKDAGDRAGAAATILKLETNIDDSTGEALGFTMDRLIEAGALDVYYTPVFMKKNRPAWMLSVLCKKEDRAKMEELIFAHTTTIGIRVFEADRTVLTREIRTVSTPWGDAKVKFCQDGEKAYPEYESVRELSLSSGCGYTELYHKIKGIAENSK